MSDTQWPLTQEEMGAFRDRFDDPHLRVEHIAEGGYAYPPGDKRRYTNEGWEIWQRIKGIVDLRPWGQ